MADWRVPVSGEVDLATAPALEAALHDAIAAPAGRVVLDCAGLTFMDSSGLRVLIEAKRALDVQGRGPDFHMVNLGEAPRRAIEIGGLSEVFNLDAPTS
jgi:anti-sigma B factor antagonist